MTGLRKIQAIVVFMMGISWTMPHAALSDPSSFPLSRDEAKSLFGEGNALYEAGDYRAAIERYSELVDGGVTDEELYYNLGNAYYKVDDLGKAVLFYLRSLERNPRHRDARENLDLVRAQLRDGQFLRERNPLLGALVWLHDHLSTGEMLVFFSSSYLVLCALIMILIFKDSPGIRRAYRRISLLSPGRLIGLSLTQDVALSALVVGVVLATSGVSSCQKIQAERQRTRSVVIEGEVGVFSSPTDDATLQFKIHQGTVVEIHDQANEWSRIRLPGGLSGWVSSKSVEKV